MKNAQSYLAVLLVFFVMGFCDIVGISSDYMQMTFHLSPFLTGLIPSLVFIWFLFLGIPVGNLMDVFGRKNTVLLGLVVTVVGMALPMLFYNLTAFVAAFIFIGIGNAILQVSLNPLLMNIVGNSKMLTSSLTMGQVIKAVSSFLGPEIILIATSIWGTENWHYCFLILGGITIVSALLLILSPIKKETVNAADNRISMKNSLSLLKNKHMLILFLGIFFVVGVDVSTNFLSSKLMMVKFGWALEEAKIAPQIYFLSRTVGALLGSFLLMRLNDIKFFKVNIIAAVISLLLWYFIQDETFNLICIGGVGFFASSVFSIIYSVALRLSPDKTNVVSGLMITAVAGGALITPLIGIVASVADFSAGIWVTVVCTLYLTYCAFAAKHMLAPATNENE